MTVPRILRNKFNERVQDLYTGNQKTSLKESKDLNKWKDISCSWIESLKVEVSKLPKLTYRFNAIFIETPDALTKLTV